MSVVPTAYGRAAAQALRDAVARAKADDALAPVTVVVPTNSVGVSARRRLASGELGSVSDAGRGVVGVTFLTVYRLAELLGAADARGRRAAAGVDAGRRVGGAARARRATRAVRAGRAAPGDRGSARRRAPRARRSRRRATRRAGRAASARARGRAAASRDQVAPRARVVRRARSHARRDRRRPRPAARSCASSAPSICFLPQRWSTPAAALLRALAERTDVEVIVGLTGVGRGRRSSRREPAARRRRRRRGRRRRHRRRSSATEVWNASDPDDEVRVIVRGVVDAMRAGVPLERMAVLYASDEPYARLLHEHFDLADIAHNGATTRSMSESVLGRGLLRIFALADTDFARDDVCGLFAAAPVLDGRGRPVPRPRWERVSREAGVVRGVDAVAAAPRRRTRRRSPTTKREHVARAQVDALGAFVAGLAAELDPARLPRTWSGFAKFAHRLVRRFFGDDARRASWPPFETGRGRAASKRCSTGWGRSTRSTRRRRSRCFRRTFELELDAARDRVGRLGDGVFVGPVGMALGVDLDRVWVCGLAEGLFPSVPRDDPLLGDRERAALGGELRLRSRSHHRRRARVARGARVDHRRARVHLPARRPAPEHRARSVAVPRGHDRGGRRQPPGEPVVRARRHPRRVPGEPTRARGAGRGRGGVVGEVRAGGGARARAHVGARREQRSPASTATSRISGERLQHDQPRRSQPT